MKWTRDHNTLLIDEKGQGRMARLTRGSLRHGAFRDRIVRDEGQPASDQDAWLARLSGAGMKDRGPGAHGIEAAFEADPPQRHAMAMRGALQEGADQVVSDRVHLAFFADHGRALAAQHVQAKDGFDLRKMPLPLPAFARATAPFRGGIRSSDHSRWSRAQRCGCESLLLPQVSAADAPKESGGELPLLARSSLRAAGLAWPRSRADLPAPARAPGAQVCFARVMQPGHGVDASPPQCGQCAVGAKAPVGEEHVAWLQALPQLLE